MFYIIARVLMNGVYLVGKLVVSLKPYKGAENFQAYCVELHIFKIGLEVGQKSDLWEAFKHCTYFLYGDPNLSKMTKITHAQICQAKIGGTGPLLNEP